MFGDPGPNAPEGPAPGLAHAAEAIHRRSRTSRLRRGLVASILTLGALTLVMEAYLRATSDRRGSFEASVNKTNRRWVALTTAGIFEEIDDPVRRYAMRPGAHCEVDGWTFRVSSQRTRGADFPAAKPEGEKRLLCLGDSFAFGLWSDEEETLVGSLAQMASARERELGSGITWRGINLGVPGYHSGQQLRAFEEDGLGLEPDVVLLYFNTNDIEQEGFFFDEDLGALYRDFLPLPTGLRRLLWRSHLYGWIVRKHTRGVERRPAPHLDPDVPYAHVREDNQAYTRAAVLRIAELCRERDLPLFIVDQPLMTFMGDTVDAGWNVLPLAGWAAELRREAGVPGIGLLGWMRGYADGVDRLGQAPPEFILDEYFADERAQEAVEYAQERARAEGHSWEELDFTAKLGYFSGYAGEIPAELDFHLLGAGYRHMARVVYTAMQSASLLP